jgi:hypothetical protein
MKTMTWTDPVVAETRASREELMSEVGNDLARLVELLMETQKRHGEKLVSFEPLQ